MSRSISAQGRIWATSVVGVFMCAIMAAWLWTPLAVAGGGDCCDPETADCLISECLGCVCSVDGADTCCALWKPACSEVALNSCPELCCLSETGACCLGGDICVEAAQKECEDGGGTWFGGLDCDEAPCSLIPESCGNTDCDVSEGETAETCPADCSPDSCCEGHDKTIVPGGGCDDPICAACVCEIDPFCCESIWDDACVVLATTTCETNCAECGTCGDGTCDPTEDCNNCPADCGCPLPSDECHQNTCEDDAKGGFLCLEKEIDCDDGDLCTADFCDLKKGGCIHPSLAEVPSKACVGAAGLIGGSKCCPLDIGADEGPCPDTYHSVLCDPTDTASLSSKFFVSVDDAPTDPADEDGSNDKPYSTIQKAVDFAIDGMILCLDAGEFSETVLVEKPVHIVGACPDATIIKDGGVVFLNAGTDSGGKGPSVRHLTILDPATGIKIVGSERSLVTNVLISQATSSGILIQDTPSPGTPPSGLFAQCSPDKIAPNVEICRVTARDGGGKGIWVNTADEIFISHVLAKNNSGAGILLVNDAALTTSSRLESNQVGLAVDDPQEDIILENSEIVANDEGGFVVTQSTETPDPIDVTVEANLFENNAGIAVSMFNGASIASQMAAVVQGNELTGNEALGVHVVRMPATIRENVVTATANPLDALSSGRAIEINRSYDFAIEDNVIQLAAGGIMAVVPSLDVAVTITGNQVFDVGMYGIAVQGPKAAEFQCEAPGNIHAGTPIVIQGNHVQHAVGAAMYFESVGYPLIVSDNVLADTLSLNIPLADDAGFELGNYGLSFCGCGFRAVDNTFSFPTAPAEAQVFFHTPVPIADGVPSQVGPGNNYDPVYESASIGYSPEDAPPTIGFSAAEIGADVLVLDFVPDNNGDGNSGDPDDLVKGVPTPCPMSPTNPTQAVDVMNSVNP